jgi:hypothetical protein
MIPAVALSVEDRAAADLRLIRLQMPPLLG